MPRKKQNLTPETAATPETAPPTESKPKRTRTPKAAAPPPEPVIEAKPARRAPKKAEPAPAPTPEPAAAKPAARAVRRPVKPVPAPAPAPAAAPEPAPKRGRKVPAEKTLAELVEEAGPEPETTPEAAPEPEPEPKKPSRRRAKAKPLEEAAAVPEIVEEITEPIAPISEDLIKLFLELDVTLPEFRKPSGERRAGPQRNAPRAAEAGEPSETGDRRSRRRRGRKEPSAAVEQPAAAAAVAEPIAPPVPDVPAVPLKPIIPIPEDAPQVVTIAGVPSIVRNGRVYPAIAFFGNARDEQRSSTVLEQMRMAGEAGVHLYSHMLEFEVEPDAVSSSVSVTGYLIKKTLEVDPEAQVLIRLTFLPPKGWQSRFPRAKGGPELGPSLSDDAYWETARDCVAEYVRQLRELDTRDSILGVHLDNGEWFIHEEAGYDIAPAATEKFRDWLRTRYGGNIVALRAAWFEGDVEFDSIRIPRLPDDSEAEEKFVRANRRERQWVDYHLFLSDQTEFRIADLAFAVKEASQGYFMVGTSYGYTFEWTHPASGHLSLGKLLRNHDIDFVGGPPSYRSREPGGSASFPGPIDSFALNGKLFLSEEDYKTSIGLGFEPDDFNPVIKSPQALESIHWRGVGAALAHGSGVFWMDLWGNGWLKTPSVWERAKAVSRVLSLRLTRPPSDPDVAVFIDERALAYLVDRKGFSLLVQTVRESLMRSGLSAAFYLLSDLQHREVFPESRLYVFLNAWDIRSELRAAIKTRLQRDGKVLFWLYTSALFDSGRDSLERAREVTGIALRPQPFHSRTGTTILNRRHPLCEAFPEKTSVGGTRLEPSYFAIPEDGTVLGEYTQTGLPSFVVREFTGDADQNWMSVFLGEPIVTPVLLRALGQMAGAHVWSFNDDVVHARPPFLTVHCVGAGQRTVALPAKWSAYDLVEEEWVQTEGTSLRFQATDGATRVFLVGVREDLEHMLSMDPADILKLAELPPKPENVARFDSQSFDVPIVRLDEWMEGGESDGLAEELLFKPRLLEEDEEPETESDTQTVGRRHRKRTRRRREDGPKKPATEDGGLGVFFRKRE